MGIIDGFLVEPAGLHFRAKVSSSVAILAQNTCVYDSRFMLYHFNANISF